MNRVVATGQYNACLMRFRSVSILLLACCLSPALATGQDAPNFIVIFADDLGYGDLACYGNRHIRTPNIDRMAAEGVRLTNFYAQNVCGPSRAALLTGCYPIRVGEPGNTKGAHTVLHPDELTIAEVLAARNYVSGLVGKWHLAGGGGHERGAGTGPYRPELMPNNQGFDYFFGTPSHNGTTREVQPRGWKTELMRNEEVLESPTDLNLLTRRYAEEAVAFIERHRERPFFLYLSHTMPHVPLGASGRFKGRSVRGLYGDVIEELDWSVGEVFAALRRLGLDERTLVVFTSDNGPWIEGHLGDHGGSAEPLKGFKMSTWEGGLRVPGIFRWPGTIAPGRVSDEIASTLDLLPTFAALAGAQLPDDRKIDGLDIGPWLSGAAERSPRQQFHYFAYTHLQAVRDGRWKLVLPRPADPPWTSWYGRMIDAVAEPELYDLEMDWNESRDLAEQRGDIVERMSALAEQVRGELGDFDRVGSGARFHDPGPRRPDMDAWRR